jgi:hypothetical protein
MKSSQRQALVKAQGIEGYFMTKTGGNISAEVTKAYDGGSSVPDLIAAPKDVDNVTISRGFDPIRDGQLLRVLRSKVGVFQTTLTVTPTDRDYAAVDEPIVYSPALLVGVNDIEVDAASGDLQVYELVWACGDVR